MANLYTIAELEKMSNKKLVSLCALKNQQACTFLYNTYAPRMLRLCNSFVKRTDIAEDIMQEGFITVFCKISRLKNPEGLKSWIYRIMLNNCINYVNRSQFNYADIDDCHDIAAPKQSDIFEYQDLCKVIDQLSDKYKVVFVKREIEGYSFEEIAKEEKLQPSTIRCMISRSKQDLKKKLSKAY